MAQTDIIVTIENLAPENGTFLTPFWVGFHDGNFDTYNRGEVASPGLESIAEDGATATISEEFIASNSGSVEGVVLGLEGIEGPIDPGETTHLEISLDSEDPQSQYFNYAAMVLPSNDAFIANGDPLAHQIFEDDGTFIGADFVILGNEVLDAGTEVNDELEASTAFFGQATPNTGDDQNGVVETHPGFIEGGRILTEDGTNSPIGAAFTSADFTAEGYEAARITITQANTIEEPTEPEMEEPTTPEEPDLVKVTVSVENLAPENGTSITPLWVGFHDGNFDTYNRGEVASPGLESIAEDGAVDTLSSDFIDSGFGSMDMAIPGNEATPGVIDPGEKTSLTFMLDRSLVTSRFLNYAAMILPSNDAFIANGNPLEHEIFDESGNFLGADFIINGSEVLDAGTEVNDEAETSTAFFGQTTPNTGDDQNGVVEIHPGFIEGGRILSSESFSNADFTAEDYQIARIMVTVEGESVRGKGEDDSLEGNLGSDMIFGGGGSDRILGLESNDTLNGNSGGDFIDGGDGDDRLGGGKDNDTLIGGVGRDRILGNLGDDLLYGGMGVDSLRGGDGSDTFAIKSDLMDRDRDLINDFVDGVDKLGLVDGLTFERLTIMNNDLGTGTMIKDESGKRLAVIAGIDASSITADDFVVVDSSDLGM